MLYLGRLLVGGVTGAFCIVTPTYIGEIAESSIRGILGSFFQLQITIGILIVYFLGAIVSENTSETLSVARYCSEPRLIREPPKKIQP